MRPAEEVGAVGSTAYEWIGSVNTFRVNPNDTTTPIVVITGRSLTYDVAFSWIVTRERYLADGPDVLLAEKVGEVDALCALPHVQGFRSEAELNRSNLLYYYGIVSVGTDDLTVLDEVAIRMDQLNTPGAFGLIDAAWTRLTSAGVTAATP